MYDVQTVQKLLLLVHEAELDAERLQATFLMIGRVIAARQVLSHLYFLSLIHTYIFTE